MCLRERGRERERERERERGGNSSEEKGVTQLGAPAPLSHSSTLTLFHSHTVPFAHILFLSNSVHHR